MTDFVDMRTSNDEDGDDIFADLLIDSEGEDEKDKLMKPKLKLITDSTKAQPTSNGKIST